MERGRYLCPFRSEGTDPRDISEAEARAKHALGPRGLACIQGGGGGPSRSGQQARGRLPEREGGEGGASGGPDGGGAGGRAGGRDEAEGAGGGGKKKRCDAT